MRLLTHPLAVFTLSLSLLMTVQSAAAPEDFTTFSVPGATEEMQLLRDLYWLHYQPAVPLIPLWDEWMPMATLWPARGEKHNPSQEMRRRWSKALSGRGMNPDGYVHTHQHDGLGHSEGWPFPLWTQAGGIGWHFRGTGIHGYDGPSATTEGWSVSGGESGEIGGKGWLVTLNDPFATLTTPSCSVDSRVAPFVRLNWWAEGLAGSDCYVEWTTEDSPEFSSERRVYFTAADSGPGPDTSGQETRTMVPLYTHPKFGGTITGYRIGLGNRGPAKLVFKSFHTACDTRHNINNTNYFRGCYDYFLWTGDLSFLRDQIERMRKAIRYMMTEFSTRDKHSVYTTWLGHEGRSGVRWEEGEKKIVKGEGIGSNYWDLLPFGGEDALATIYYYDTIRELAKLEEAIASHPEWNIAVGASAFDPGDLRNHAKAVREYGTERFWNPETGRFGTVDLEGNLHDYGLTFLNNEAIYYDFATPEQAKEIRAWISGERKVDGDTSTGQDIYHWRFGPRSTTLRNIDYYFWAWSSPENLPWGGQVQDGGGVLGFSYHDLMAMLEVEGPDKTWSRLKEILDWFAETQEAGGYRKYYAQEGVDGTLQGGGTPGGLGLDHEFFESILVPQVMLYGFLGLELDPEGISLSPSLPSDWPELTIDRIHYRDTVLSITVKPKEIQIQAEGRIDHPIPVKVSGGWSLTAEPEGWFSTER